MLLPKRVKKYIDKGLRKPIVLDDRVDAFIEWYKNNIVNEHYTDIGAYLEPIELKNLIEKWLFGMNLGFQIMRLIG